MIYEICDGFLEAVQNQWRDLSYAFQRLAQALVNEGRPKAEIDQVGSPNDGVSIGYQKTADDEVTSLSSYRNQIKSDVVFDLLKSTPNFLRTTKKQVDDIKGAKPFVQKATPNELVELAVCRKQLEDLQAFIMRALNEFDEMTAASAQGANLNRLTGTVEDIASYPLLTSDMTITPILPSTSSGGGSPSLQRVIDNTMRQVLGRLPKPNDPRSFQAALAQSFEINEFEGHTIFKWTPRSFSGQTELGGGVTGAQASLYSRAKVTLDQSLPLLDGLYPLLPDADEQLVEAAKAIVRAEMIQLVQELGIEGGPRVARVNGLFNSLLFADTTDEINTDPTLTGHIGYLQAVMGLRNEQVNTLQEEANFSNFILLRDWNTALYHGCQSFLKQWHNKDMGTRLVLLSRALSVTAEAVNEVLAAMDSVFVGSAERQVARFNDDLGHPILIEELLSWVVTFASEEAPQLVHEGGRKGVVAIIPTAQQLVTLVAQLIRAVDYDPLLPTGLRHPRVKNPLRELNGYLQQIERIAQDIYRPVQIQ